MFSALLCFCFVRSFAQSEWSIQFCAEIESMLKAFFFRIDWSAVQSGTNHLVWPNITTLYPIIVTLILTFLRAKCISLFFFLFLFHLCYMLRFLFSFICFVCSFHFISIKAILIFLFSLFSFFLLENVLYHFCQNGKKILNHQLKKIKQTKAIQARRNFFIARNRTYEI